MAAARPLPAAGSIFLDTRGGDRALRVTWHHDVGTVVLSLWRENVCAASFRLPAEEVPRLLAVLAEGLAAEQDAETRPVATSAEVG